MAVNRGSPAADKTRVWLKRLSRISALALLLGVIILAVSGWGITQTGIIFDATFGLVDRRLANSIHRAANVPLAFFVIAHVLINIRLALSVNRRLRARVASGLLIAIGLALLAVVVYMEYFTSGG